MNKLGTFTATSLLALSLSGCSFLELPPTIWGSDEKTTCDQCEADARTLSPGVESDFQTPPKSLGDYAVTSFPAWMSIESDEPGKWASFKADPARSFGSVLSANGVDNDWLGDLRRSDYIELTTVSPSQDIYVLSGEDGDFEYLYTSPQANKWMSVEMIGGSPVLSHGARPVTRESGIILKPESKPEDFSSIQKRAISEFLENIEKSMSNQVGVMLTKGHVELAYQYTQLPSGMVADVKVKEAVAQFAGHIMHYIPEPQKD